MKKYFLLLFLFGAIFQTKSATSNISTFINDYLSIRYGKVFTEYLFISIKNQKLYYIKEDKVISSYLISSAKNGVGQDMHSGKTPEGLHIIQEKIGTNLPKGALFSERIFNGKISKIYTDTIDRAIDEITSRILWLSGEEEGVNKGGNIDTFNRYIYIHGTPEEGLIGRPASHGCIRMINKEIIELYELIPTKTPVLILNY